MAERIDVLTEPFVGELQTGHYMYEWADRPHERVGLMRVRARITDPAPDIGRHSLRARATDAAGNVQPDVPAWTGSARETTRSRSRASTWADREA
jgi:hypothetical protein